MPDLTSGDEFISTFDVAAEDLLKDLTLPCYQLPDWKPSHTPRHGIRAHLDRFANLIRAITDRQIVGSKGAVVLGVELKSDYAFKFRSPSLVKGIGSVVSASCASKVITLDVAVEMPLRMFGDVESYESLRALYFVHLQSQLSSSYECQVCDDLVELAASGSSFCGRDVRLRLHPCLPSGGDLPPSHPVLDADRLRLEADEFVQTRMRRCPASSRAVMLLKLWSERRRVCVRGFVWASLVAALLENGTLLTDMSAIQMMRSVLLFALDTSLETTSPLAVALDGCQWPLWSFSSADLELLHHYIRLSLPLMATDDSLYAFQQLFTCESSVSEECDAVLHLTVEGDCGVPLQNELHSVLKRAYTDRVRTMRIQPHQDGALVGLMLCDGAEWRRECDLGPSAELKQECAEFRRFWGTKSKLRRFKDGSIREAVVWDQDENVLECIARHALRRHCIGVGVKRCVVGSELVSECVLPSLPPAVSFATSFQRLQRLLLDLPLPLAIKQVVCTDELLRGTAVLQGDSIPVLVETDASRWPADVVAMARIKTALYVRMASLLQEEAQVAARAFHNYLDVWLDDTAFTLRLWNAAELRLDNAAQVQFDFVTKPLLQQELLSVAQRFPAFGPTARIVKRWLSSHLMHESLAGEAVELLVASVFLSPACAMSPPSTPLAAFLRFLRLLVSFPFKTTPIIVDLHQDLTKVQRELAERAGEELLSRGERELAILSFRDLESSHWTKATPTRLQMNKLLLVARSSLQHLHGLVVSALPAPLSAWKTAFKPSLKKFELFMVLKHVHVRHVDAALFPCSALVRGPELDGERRAPQLKAAPPSLQSRLERQRRRPLNCCPVRRFLQELSNTFEGVVSFSYDANASDLIVGKLCKPKNGSLAYRRQTTRSGPTVLDVRAIAHDISRIGDGLLHSVFTSYDAFRAAR